MHFNSIPKRPLLLLLLLLLFTLLGAGEPKHHHIFKDNSWQRDVKDKNEVQLHRSAAVWQDR